MNNSNENIIIAIFTPALHNSGGVKALHTLAQKINIMKYKNISAKLICMNNGFDKYNNSYCNDFMHPSEINEYTVVVYPEIVKGNPLKAKHVIRWILMELGENINPLINLYWKKEDIVYHWEPSIWQTGVKNIRSSIKINQLAIPFIDKEFIKYNNNERTKTCYLIKKGHGLHNLKKFMQLHPNNSINIESMSLHDIVKTFNECHTFFCYDPNTFYIAGAPLCGCISIIYPLANMNEDDFFKNRLYYKDNFLYKSGISYGFSQENINIAKQTLNDSPIQLNNLLSKYEASVEIFLNDIHDYMKYNKKLITIENVYNHTFKNLNSKTPIKMMMFIN